MGFDILKPHAGNIDSADPGNTDGTIAVHGDTVVDVHLPPRINDEFIPRSDQIVQCNRHAIQRGKRRRHILKEIKAEQG